MSPSPSDYIRATLVWWRTQFTKACAHDPLDLRREVGGWECGKCAARIELRS